MAPILPSAFDYAFSHKRLSQLRAELELTQAELADLLDVPVNTVSRWETGKTTPDAHALAAIYSITVERSGEPPEFFEWRPGPLSARLERESLVIMWDFQNISFDPEELDEELDWFDEYIDLMYPHAAENKIARAYATSSEVRNATQPFREHGFKVGETWGDADRQLIADAERLFTTGILMGTPTIPATMAASSQRVDPEDTTFILVADDGDYAALLRDLSEQGVDVHLWATDDVSRRLRSLVDKDHFIEWDAPYVIAKCFEVIEELDERTISPSEFGNTCKQAFDSEGYDIYPPDAGFSRNRPYISVLRWMEKQELVSVKRTGKGKSQTLQISSIEVE